jgi:predicted nucleic acid-binding protein
VGLIDDAGPGPIAVDTAPFIYLIEEHPRYLTPLLPLFETAAAGGMSLVTSAVTLLEVLVAPYRAGDTRLADRYAALLTRSRGVTMIEISIDQLRAAARLRAARVMRTPDALQVAAALTAGCPTLVTNDRRLPNLAGLRVLQVSDYC